MASRTTRRNSFSVKADNDDFNINYYNQAEFKGINTNKNDIAVDPATFADTNNVYVDDNSVLVSRPPIKLYDNRPWIVKEWIFGNYEFRLQKLLMDDEDNRIDYPQQWAEEWEKTNTDPTDSAYQHWHYMFLLYCISHETFSGELPDGSTALPNLAFNIDYSAIGYADVMPAIYATQIEDKVYFWVAGQFLYDFNCSGVLTSTGERMSYFEESTKYLYYPIHKLIINGIESDLETKNFLTETYRRRYQYSTLSSVNFDTLVGRKFTVNLNGDMTQDQTQKLYDITVGQNQRLAMIYPYAELGNNYIIDMVQTTRANVFMRQNIVTNVIEVSYGGRIWHALPTLENVIGKPLLTKDGMWCVAFTTNGVAKCQLVAQTTEDIAGLVDYFNWTIVPYAQNNVRNQKVWSFTEIDPTYEPHGYFETIDNFVYCFKAASGYVDISFNVTYVYAEWLRGTEDRVCGIYEAVGKSGSDYIDIMPNDDIKLHFKYVTPTVDNLNVGAFVSILNAENMCYMKTGGTDDSPTYGYVMRKNFVINAFFKVNDEATTQKGICSGNMFNWLKISDGLSACIIYKFTDDGKSFVPNGTQLKYGDKVAMSFYNPYNVTPHTETRTYKFLDAVYGRAGTSDTYDSIYIAIKDVPGDTKLDNESYWVSAGGYYAAIQYDDAGHAMNIGTPAQIFLCPNGTLRYVYGTLKSPSGKTGDIQSGDDLQIDIIDADTVSYSASEIQAMVGSFVPDPGNVGTAGSADTTNKNWNDVAPIIVNRNWTGTVDANDYTAPIYLYNMQNAFKVAVAFFVPLATDFPIKDENNTEKLYSLSRFNSAVDQMDIECSTVTIDVTGGEYDVRLTTTGTYIAEDSTTVYLNSFVKYKMNYTYNDAQDRDIVTLKSTKYGINMFSDLYNYSCKLLSGSNTVLTDNFIWFPEIDDVEVNPNEKILIVGDTNLILFPRNNKLEPVITDENRQIINGDTILLASKIGEETEMVTYEFNVHRVSQDFTSLSNEQIRSDTIIAAERYAVTAEDYLMPDNITGTSATGSHFYRIQAIGAEFPEEGGAQWTPITNNLVRAQWCRFLAYDQQVTVPAGTDTNPTTQQITIQPNLYPAAPDGWKADDGWPAEWAQYPQPIYLEQTGANTAVARRWQPADGLPSGQPIAYYGAINIVRKTQPLSIGSEGVWMLVNGALWTSQPLDGNIVEMDEYAGCDFDADNNMVPRVNYVVPTHSATLNEHFFSFVQDGKNLIEVTSTRRDEEKIFSDKGNDLLLYMPEVNEQVIANKITALHNLSEVAMGLFTEDATYYINAIEQESGGILYSKPIKSKIPFGLRDGDEIITALDGQALIFPTARGLAAMAPEDFVATTERSISYLSDAIQDLYEDFYSNPTEALEIMKGMGERVYYPIHIHINTYRYWVLMWREYDRRVFALDTRTGTWWKWETAYPLTIVFVTDRLHLVQYINFNPYTPEGWILPPQRAPFLGWDCVLCDKEMDYDYQIDGEFPTLEDANMTYDDATIDGALNGDISYTPDGTQQVYYAEPRIKWHIVSQKMSFSAPNNYKKIRQIVLNAKGTKPVSTKLSTKVFRDLTHPEQSTVMEIKINDVRTFVKYVNFMHVTNFQYRLENDVNVDTDNQLRLNLLGIKYEVKENIR